MFELLRSPVPKIVPIFAIPAMRADAAIAQTAQQPPPIAPSVAVSDPIATYGVVASLSLSMGMLLINGFKGYVANLGRRSEIELKAQESQNQRSQDIAATMLKQQEIFVANMIENQKNDRLELARLIERTNEAQTQATQTLETLTDLIRSKL